MAYVNNAYALSIVIPTYNRSRSLQTTLDSIVSQKGFDSNIEVIISDNSSTDNTKYMVLKFCEKYENIKYYRNETNVKDKNFPIAISYANGEYVKILSDNKPLRYNFINELLRVMKNNSAIIFHLNNSKRKIIYKNTKNINEFIYNASFYSTWLPAYTFKASIIKQIDIFSINTNNQLFQTELALRVLNSDPSCQFIIGKTMDDIQGFPKGGYDLLKVFVENYLEILRQSHHIYSSYYIIEKNRLFIKFIIPWLINIKIYPYKYTFNVDDIEKYIEKYYKYNILKYILYFI